MLLSSISLFAEPPSSFRRDLMVGHLVNGFDTDDPIAESRIPQSFFDFVLRLAGAQNQDGPCIPNCRYHLVVVAVEMTVETPVAPVL